MSEFRRIPKEYITIGLPPELATRIRHAASNARYTLSEVIAETICYRLGIDPTTYGIAPRKIERKAHAARPQTATDRPAQRRP